MASLNTLRTKFGIVLSIIIAFALLAFILSLKTEMGFSGNDPKVGVIDGEKITYSEYYDRYEQIKSQSGVQESDEQQSAMLANAVWQSLVSNYVFEPGLAKMGLRLTDAERLALLSGEQFSQTLYNYFADPRTGEYNVAAVSNFLTQADADPQAAAAWKQLSDQLRLETMMTKYYGLVRGGAYVNKLEVANGRKTANETYAGKWTGKRYAEVPDSLFTVSSSEIKAYYNAHKNAYKRLPSRTLSYVLFEVSPTDEDMQKLEQEVKMVGEEFAAAADPKAFARGNRFGTIAENYVPAARLTGDEAEALMAGKTYGPVLKNNEWTMARALDTKTVPDSLGIRHIVLSYTQEELADSLLTALRRGGDFAEAARQHSLAETGAAGGEVGVMPFSAFTGDFVAALASAKQGDIVKIASGDAIQLMQIYRAGKPEKHVQVASITYPVEASSATRRQVHAQAGTFTVNAKKGGEEAFAEAAATAAVTPRTATLVQGDRTLRGLEDSREVARWAYGAEEGDLSEIFKVGDDYVIARLTEIDDDTYTEPRKVAAQIRQQLLRDKKFDYIKGQMSGSTLEEIAAGFGSEVGDFSDVSFGAYYMAGPGLEPRVIGAIATTTEQGKVSEPVKGLSGLYVFRVDAIDTEDAQSTEAEQVRAQAVLESMVGQYALQAVQQMAEIEDLRGKYF